jgi:nucleoside-diphosphate-sugar epimerase
MYKILVTGGAGMIGSNLVKRFIKEGYSVKVVDNLWRGKLEYLNNINGDPVIDIENQFFNRDLSLPHSCVDLLKDIDYVVHLADIVAGIGYVFNNEMSIFRQNILINSNTINAVSKSKIKGFLYIGTACSFPETLQNSLDYIPLKEDDLYPAQPESAYGWSKLMGQYETELLEKEKDIKTCTLMLHNVYGTPCDYSPERSQVIPSLIRKAINYPNEKFIVWGSGEQGRAFIHVDDVVNGILLALEKGWGHGHIQLGPSICTSIKDIAETIVDISNKDIEINYDLSKPEGDKARSADFSKAKTILGWEPLVDFKKGLKEQYNWIEEQINCEKSNDY